MKDVSAIHNAEYGAFPAIIAAAPGIVKFLGEHTNPFDGLVLATALSYEIQVAVSFRKDNALRFYSADLGERKRTSVATLKYKREDRWANYPKAIIDQLLKEGVHLQGLNFTIAGNIPVSLGFAASTALCTASALALRELFGLSKKSEKIAELAQQAEQQFLSHPVPLFEYLACAVPGGNTASIIDVKLHRRRAVPFVGEDNHIILTESRVPSSQIEAEIASRIEEAQVCIAEISKKGVLKPNWKQNYHDILDHLGAFPERVRRRGIHIIDEIVRVGEAEEALTKGDFPTFGKIINKSHNSLRSLYEVSCPEIDWLAKRALEIPGVLCSRLTGKGFGGCTVSIMQASALDDYKKRLEDYERIFGLRPIIHKMQIPSGLRICS